MPPTPSRGCCSCPLFVKGMCQTVGARPHTQLNGDMRLDNIFSVRQARVCRRGVARSCVRAVAAVLLLLSSLFESVLARGGLQRTSSCRGT
jgi:hypothetical protein